MNDPVDLLFNCAFSVPRAPRSMPYKEGVRAALVNRVNGTPVSCPHDMGTAEADAFFAGVHEGYAIWRYEHERVAGGKAD